ncbi:MAG: carboxymuconolactone decarboxylase family protein [Thermoplasmatota archaeon]
MPHISVDPSVPGIRAFMNYRPDTGKALSELAEALLRGPSPLTAGERELVASFVSNRNHCRFCTASHSAAAKHQLGGGAADAALVEAVKSDYKSAAISEKMKALLAIAEKVQGDARTVTKGDIDVARRAGATDRDIHDAVLIAAAFCMFNRYVDGLAATTPSDGALYDLMGERMAKNGYLQASILAGGKPAPLAKA